MRVLYLSSLVLGATALSAKPKGKHVDKAAARVGGKHVIAAHNKEKKVAKKVEAEKQSTESTDTEIPTATQCIVNLLTQYFGLWTGLVLLRKFRESTQNKSEDHWSFKAHQILDEATASLSLAPAMAILFLAARYRATQLAAPRSPESAGMPAPYCQTAMLVATWGVFAQMAMTFLRGMVVTCMSSLVGDGCTKWVLWLLRHAIALCVLGGTGVVCHGVIYMHPKDGPATLDVSPAVQCVILLTVTYFAVVIALEIARSIRQIKVPFLGFEGESFSAAENWETWLKGAANAMSLSPMLALLFLAARMQAQANGMEGPAEFTQQVFFATTYGMIASVLMNIILPLCFGAELKKSNMDSEMIVTMEGPLAGFFTFLNGLITFAIYGGFIYVVYTMINIAGLDSAVVALSTGQQSIIFLINMYFSVLGLLWIFLAGQKFTEVEPESFHARCIDCLTAAKYTVCFAPMSAVLIMTANIRAGEITKGASPQPYVQNCMQWVTMAILAQLVMAIFGPFVGLTIQIERDGNVKAPTEGGSWFARTLVQLVSYASMIAMYAGVCGMVHGIFTMTPETVQ